jgi:hypothetical protein
MMSSAVVTLQAGLLPIGSYIFTLVVSKGGGSTGYELRNTTSTASVEVVAGAPPKVTLTRPQLLGPSADKVNPEAGLLEVTGSARATSASGTNLTSLFWTAIDADTADPFFLQGTGVEMVSSGALDSRTVALSAVLNLATLTPGSTYSFQLIAQDSSSEGYAAFSLTVNEPPSSGSLTASPKSGSALTTSFYLSALLWVDDDLPFTFVFGTAPVVAIGATKTYAADMSDISQLVPFGDERGDAFYRGVILPQGQLNINYSTACFTQVIDYLGAGTFGSTTVRVVPAELTSQQLLTFSTIKSQEHRDSGDSNAAKQVLRASAKASTVVADGQQRRRLRSLTQAEKQAAYFLRASLLSDLWATYKIIPRTQLEIASHLGVLGAIVEQPTEVTDQVAAGAVEFASMVSCSNSFIEVTCF